MGFEVWLGYIIAAITSLSTVVVSIRSSAKDASDRAKDATIESQQEQLNVITSEKEMYKQKFNEVAGQVKALQDIVTQAPAIAELTKEVTTLVSSVQSQIEAQKTRDAKIFKLLEKSVREGK